MGSKIFLSAGEASGDLHGAALVKAILERSPHSRITCLGGDLLRSAGARVLVDNREVSVVGLSEVLRHASKIYEAWRNLTSFLVREKPDLIILIDFPDFNFLLGRFARRHGIKVFYYISPQVWAWRRGRVRALKSFVDTMAVILPFEEEFYRERGMKVHYVGHPLLDVLQKVPSRDEAQRKYRPHDRSGPVVGLLPGSRSGEIRSLLPLLLGTGRRILARFPQASFLLPLARTIDPALVLEEGASFFHAREALASHGDDDSASLKSHFQGMEGPHSMESVKGVETGGHGEQLFPGGSLPLKIVRGDSYGVMQACDLLLCASGTVTLEAAILNVPMIIVYKVSPLSAFLARHLIHVSHAGLPNIIAGRTIVPEFLQDNAREDCLAEEAIFFLEHPHILELQRNQLAQIRGMLGAPGVARRVSELVLHTLALS